MREFGGIFFRVHVCLDAVNIFARVLRVKRVLHSVPSRSFESED